MRGQAPACSAPPCLPWQVTDKYGRLDVLVNNAAIQVGPPSHPLAPGTQRPAQSPRQPSPSREDSPAAGSRLLRCGRSLPGRPSLCSGPSPTRCPPAGYLQYVVPSIEESTQEIVEDTFK